MFKSISVKTNASETTKAVVACQDKPKRSRPADGTSRISILNPRSSIFLPHVLASPQFLGGQPGAFRHGFELGPADLRAADSRSQAAISTGHDVFFADDLGVAH